MLVMPEVAVQRLIQFGISQLRKDKTAFDEIFEYPRSHPLMTVGYGIDYVDRIWDWFTTERIRVVQSWVLNPSTVPCYSVHLSSEQENEAFAAISDHYGDEEEFSVGVASFNVTIDVGIHGTKAADQVLWLYYILNYILFKYKNIAQGLGIEIQTFSVSDWQKEAARMPENIWSRWLKMRLTVFNTWTANEFNGPFDVDVDVFVDPAIRTPKTVPEGPMDPDSGEVLPETTEGVNYERKTDG